jgi:hypothetical protein
MFHSLGYGTPPWLTPAARQKRTHYRRFHPPEIAVHYRIYNEMGVWLLSVAVAASVKAAATSVSCRAAAIYSPPTASLFDRR